MPTNESVFASTWQQDRVFAESEMSFAFPTNIPITPGHTLIVPKRVVETLEQLNEDELVDLFRLSSLVKSALRKVFDAKGFNHAWNEGADFGQSVPHLHLHIVPRTKGDSGIFEYDPRVFLYRPGSRSESPNEELEHVATQLKTAMPSDYRAK